MAIFIGNSTSTPIRPAYTAGLESTLVDGAKPPTPACGVGSTWPVTTLRGPAARSAAISSRYQDGGASTSSWVKAMIACLACATPMLLARLSPIDCDHT